MAGNDRLQISVFNSLSLPFFFLSRVFNETLLRLVICGLPTEAALVLSLAQSKLVSFVTQKTLFSLIVLYFFFFGVENILSPSLCYSLQIVIRYKCFYCRQ